MKKTGSMIPMIFLTALTLSAGFAAGMLAKRLPIFDQQTTVSTGNSELIEQLQLTPDQSDKMRVIWEKVRSDVQRSYQDADDLQKRRDRALVGLLDDRQKAEFEKLSADFADQFKSVSQNRDSAFQDAVDQTRKLLNETQRKKYELILKERLRRSPTTSEFGALPTILGSGLPSDAANP